MKLEKARFMSRAAVGTSRRRSWFAQVPASAALLVVTTLTCTVVLAVLTGRPSLARAERTTAPSSMATTRAEGRRCASVKQFAAAAYDSVTTTIVIPPPVGSLYHGVFPGGHTLTGAEDDVTDADVASYETSVAHQVAWVYFSNNWYRSRKFPWSTARMIRDRGAVPYIRLMLRSGGDNPRPEPVYKLTRILRGDFDDALRRWAYSARAFGTPLIVEYGTEVNGEWFSWNGRWNGGWRRDRYGSPTWPDGPERFVYAYRRIIRIMRGMGARNIVWVFHINNAIIPYTRWNSYRYYYPGGAYVNWIAVSAYGAQSPQETDINTFRSMMDYTYPRLATFDRTKPVMVSEFASDVRNPNADASVWARDAIDDMVAGRWPRVRGFSWWNEGWENDDDPAHDTSLRVQDSPALANVFVTELNDHSAQIVCRPVFGTR